MRRMRRFTVGNLEVYATSAEMAYLMLACWFNPATVVCVTDDAGNIQKFSRKLDACGNLIEIIRR